MKQRSTKISILLCILSAAWLYAANSSKVDETIKTVGPTLPDWYAQTKLNYPKTLDLSGTKKASGWQPRVNLGAYKWSIINPNPKRWKEGVRLLHHVVEYRKNDRTRQIEAMNMLATSYFGFFQDYARAAYWWTKALKCGGRPSIHALANVAECYWRLGDKKKAMALLSHYQMMTNYPHKRTCRLLSDMGEHEKAISLAKACIRSHKANGYMATAQAYRASGDFASALEYYKKVQGLNMGQQKEKLMHQCAVENIKGLQLFDQINLSKIPNGTYTGTSLSYRGPLSVRVTVKSGKITAVNVSKTKDDRYFLETAKRKMLDRIVKAQQLKKVDAISGATISSNAIINATAKALYSRKK